MKLRVGSVNSYGHQQNLQKWNLCHERHLYVQLSLAQQVRVSLRLALTLQFCMTSDCCRLLNSPQISEPDKTRLEIQEAMSCSLRLLSMHLLQQNRQPPAP